ncbi:MAG: tetratricopeptide repeat protein [Cytophagales bacterium]|nr:tetratricopeptide repeat protein [Cytophagales bacterium]
MLINRVFLHLIFVGLALVGLSQSMQIQLANEYYQQGEVEKAKTIYDELAKDRRYISRINANYLEVLKQIGEQKEIEKYLSQIIKWYPSNIAYQIEEIAYYFERDDQKKYQQEVNSLREQYGANRFQLSMIAQQLANKRMYHQSAEFFLIARKASSIPSSYALEMARVYGLLNEKQKMVDEYLTYARENRQNTAYIKNIFQNLLKDEGDLSYLENALIERMQQEPNERTYPDLMIWVELQRKNFYGAFLQARALDKREQTNGNQSQRVGKIAIDNEGWDDAISIFTYLTKNYQAARNQSYYRKMLIEAKEGKAKSTFPVNKAAIKSLVREYRDLYEELGPNNYTFEALRNLASLHAFYLGEIDTAAIVLRHLISSPRVGKILVAQAKLDLGDIYILRDNPWEATLLYSQVEKAHRDSPLAYEAKLKNARLHYFTGNFSLAKSHLDILKRATTREISNDAIDLTVLITDNTFLDSTDVVMQAFASIELMIFQHQHRQATQALKQMLITNKGHSISDEVYWLLAKLYIQAGEFHEAIAYLEKITTEFGYDILADDASFKIAEITDKNLDEPEAAQELYRKFISTYPGSMYTSEARNRFRKLRGDFGT